MATNIGGTESAQERARERQDVLEALFTQATDGMVVIDVASLRFHEFNDAACAALGYTRDEFQRLTLVDLQGGMTMAEVSERMATLVAAGGGSFEVRHRAKDGTVHDIWAINHMVTTDAGAYMVAIWRDVTDRHQVEARLRETEQRFRDFASAAADWWFWEMNAELRFTYFSENVVSGTGQEAKNLLGKRRHDLATPVEAEQRAKWAQHLDDLEHHRDIRQFEYCQLGANGEDRWVSISGVPTFNSNGHFAGYRGTGTDISVRKKAERDRETSDRILRAAINVIDEGFVLYDENDRLVLSNDKYRQIYATSADLLVPGASFEEIIRKGAARGQYPAAVGRIDEWVRERLDAHRSGHTRIEQQLDDGRWLRIVESRTQDGYTVGFRVDITELKKKELALERSEEKFRLLSENASDWIYSTSSEGKPLYHSPACEEITGYTPREFMDDSELLTKIVHPDDMKVFACHLDQPHSRHDLMFRIVRRDGAERWIAHLCQPMFDDAGKMLGRRAANRDITDRKRIGKELDQYRHHLEELVSQRTSQLAAANRAKTAFLANMSHEIRTPMNAIVSLSQLAEQRSNDPAQKLLMQKVTTAAGHLLGIINDILDISKIEAGKLTLEENDFTLREVIDEAMQLLADQAQSKGLALTADVSTELPAIVTGDRARLSQVLINLLGNAVKFTDRGSVTLRVRTDPTTDGELAVRFDVIDTGIGIDETARARLFESFEQADTTTTRRYGGTGLGLAISRTLVELMGGGIGVESDPGRGSTFWFTTRLKQRRDNAIAQRKPSMEEASILQGRVRNRCHGKRVLVVEDNVLNQEVLGELLRGTGLAIDLATDGQQALDRAQRQRYDLVLMDIQMPVMDGMTATRAMRKLPDWANVPIVAVTANAFEKDRLQCQAAGMNDFLPKPITPNALMAALLRWLPNAAPESPAESPVIAAECPMPVAEEPDFIRALRSIEGMDVQRGLESLRGKAASYARMLGVFVATHGGDMQNVRNQLAAGAIAEARRVAHSLKGASATLGINNVQAHALALEQALKMQLDGAEPAPGQLESLIAAVENVQAPLMKSLERVLPPAAPR